MPPFPFGALGLALHQAFLTGHQKSPSIPSHQAAFVSTLNLLEFTFVSHSFTGK